MTIPNLISSGHVLAHVRGRIGWLTLNRASALNALSLPMIRDITSTLLNWKDEGAVAAVIVQGAGRAGKSPAFCAGGDIRFFHEAALAGDPQLEDFFTEEYALNHLIHHYPKPYIALMDGVVIGGGMGISQGAAQRVVTEHSKLAMPETNIGLFPDVGGGWFLARCPGHVGEYLALTGQVIGASDAIAFGLADEFIPSGQLPALVDSLVDQPMDNGEQALAAVRARTQPPPAPLLAMRQAEVDRHFTAASLPEVLASLASDTAEFASSTLAQMQKRSPLMMAVSLEQVRRARQMDLSTALRMERDLVRNCFHLRAESETVEGIRALVIDKDHSPQWKPADVSGVLTQDVEAFFVSPWPAHAHPLRAWLP